MAGSTVVSYIYDSWGKLLSDIRKADKVLAPIADVDLIDIDGMTMNWEQFGNFHYGLVGHAGGFPYEVLR